MKMLLTAVAAVAMAGAAYAQQTPAPSSPPPATDVTPNSSATPDGSSKMPNRSTVPASRDASAEAAGGYQPSQPAVNGTPAPGSSVITTPSPSVDAAYPAPSPKANYPWCSRTITDECRQRGG